MAREASAVVTDDEFVAVIRICQGYWSQEWPAETLDVWSEQMRRWDAELARRAAHQLGETLRFLPKFAEIAEAYRIEKVKDRPASSWGGETRVDREFRDRWDRVIRAQIATKPIGLGPRQETVMGRAIKPHYRLDGSTVVVMDGSKMLAAAESAMAEDAFGG